MPALLERHLARSPEWFPHRYVPWDEGRACAAQPGGREPAPLGEGTASALFVGLLTEDNLPHYFHSLASTFAPESAMGEWIRRWSAEEQRHSIVIRDWVSVTRSLDLEELERARLHLVSSPWPDALRAATVVDGLVYVALQELSTRVFHWRTGDVLGGTGQQMLRRVAADENLHYLFYRDIISAILAAQPSPVVEAIERQLASFQMPGAAIEGFSGHARAIAASGIYDYSVYHDQVVQPLVTTHWQLESVSSLTAAGERARDRVIAYCERLRRVARRMDEQREEAAS